MNGEQRNPWNDPNVQDALKQGRGPEDISLIACQHCGVYGYYNDGSGFCCRACGWSAGGRAIDALIDNAEVITLDDYTGMMAEQEEYP
jgi:hypothetical protein